MVWVLLIAVVALLVALPFALPPVVEKIAADRLREFGMPARVRMTLGYCWRNGPGVRGNVELVVRGTPWRIRADYGASCCEWEAAVVMDETPISEHDFVIANLLRRFPIKDVSDLRFSGQLSLKAEARRTFSKPMPVWKVRAPVKLDASMKRGENDVAIEGLEVTLGASGIGDHFDIAPIFPRAKGVQFKEFKLTDMRASLRATERAMMVNEATAGFCGGTVSVFALFLDMKSFNTGFTMFVDGVDAGEALAHVRGFSGDATGKLHGKVKLFIAKGGKSMRLSDAFLYSTPGEIGSLKMADTEPIEENLAMTGLDDATRANVSKALKDLRYSVLKMDLRRGEGKEATLSLRVAGSSTCGSTTVPVDITININGEIEQILNTGLGIAGKMKGKKE